MIWLNAQLSPHLASWIQNNLSEDCLAVRDVGLRDAGDFEIYQAAKAANVIVMTKDRDFVELLYVHESPPKIIWLTCGNTSNANLKIILATQLSQAMILLNGDEDLVEIR